MSLGTVLIVDDEPDPRELLGHLLRKNDFETRQAPDGLSACRLIGEEHPDLVVLDLLLPDLDGREVCRMVRSHTDPAVASTPILMLTALSATADRLTGLHVGADDYLAKPFSIDEVVLRAKRLVAARKRSDALQARAKGAVATRERLLEFQDLLFHELKNQLVVVSGFSSRICEHGDLLPPEKIRSYAHEIRRSSNRLGLLAEEMLVLRKLDGAPGSPQNRWIDLRLVLEHVLDIHRAALEEKHLLLTLAYAPELAAVSGDLSSARIALSCLVENAIQHSNERGTVRIDCAPLSENWLAVTVEDEGSGIPEGELDRIFERFYQGSNSLNRPAGTGLGLYFAKSFAEALGGRLTVESELGRGSRFRLELQTA